jgi:hypothetical protein
MIMPLNQDSERTKVAPIKVHVPLFRFFHHICWRRLVTLPLPARSREVFFHANSKMA